MGRLPHLPRGAAWLCTYTQRDQRNAAVRPAAEAIASTNFKRQRSSAVVRGIIGAEHARALCDKILPAIQVGQICRTRSYQTIIPDRGQSKAFVHVCSALSWQHSLLTVHQTQISSS
jgi:hypothetical protein